MGKGLTNAYLVAYNACCLAGWFYALVTGVATVLGGEGGPAERLGSVWAATGDVVVYVQFAMSLEIFHAAFGLVRSPLVTTHKEHDVAIVVDLNACFFSPRLATERLRISKAVGRGERVLCLFAGCGPEALLISAKTACERVVAVESNAVATACLARSRQTLRRSKGDRVADKLEIVTDDALAELRRRADSGETFDRVTCPRPKGRRDGDRVDGDTDDADDGGGGGGGPDGALFLRALLPLLTPTSVVHWTDFAADRELPDCARTRAFLERECAAFGAGCHVLHCARAGTSSVAARQYRVTVDFRLGDAGPRAPSVHPHNLPLRGTQRPRD